jgi:hypothetical protein
VKGPRNDLLKKVRPEQPPVINDHNGSGTTLENERNDMEFPDTSTFLENKRK